ncbi:DUF3024 domain-containing protein [Klebsiella variicola]|nr:DUF3024 domain-containing protein [Klebsiella variicola]
MPSCAGSNRPSPVAKADYAQPRQQWAVYCARRGKKP